MTATKGFVRLSVCGLAVLARVLGASCLPARAQAEQAGPFPAAVRVTADHTYLRSGPGDDYYPTERLPAGTALELWAVDPSGYGAVRPVEGSFAWLRGCDVESAPGGRGVGVIVTDGAVARVGSQLNDLRHAAQVTLEAGERVVVIEEVRIAAGRHAGLWVRIEPPAGEFRWVRLADLEMPPGLAPRAAPPDASAAPSGAAALGEAIAAIKDASLAVAQAVQPAEPGPPEAIGEGGTATPALGATAAPPPRTLGFMPQARRLFAGWLPRGSGVFDAATPIAPVAVSAGGPAAPHGSAEELADIDLALSLAVTGPPDSWNLAPVRERLRQVAARTDTGIDRTRVEAIDARLARFEAIQGRHRTLAATAAPAAEAPLQLGSMWSSLSAIGSRPIRPGVMPGGAAADGQPAWTPPDMTETTGRLATVVSRRPDAPRWAVVDQNNNVIAFVTPQAGLNLAPMVGQDVSVRGAKGYMPEYKRPYVVAAEARPRMAAAPEASPDRAVR